jgi:hypothetical protein
MEVGGVGVDDRHEVRLRRFCARQIAILDERAETGEDFGGAAHRSGDVRVGFGIEERGRDENPQPLDAIREPAQHIGRRIGRRGRVGGIRSGDRRMDPRDVDDAIGPIVS